MCVLVLTAGTAATLRTVAVLARHRAETAADLAALAAAGGIGVSADPCSAARQVAGRNAAEMQLCRLHLDPSGRSGTVVVRVRVALHLPVVGERQLSAAARAGRVATSHPLPP